MESRFMRTELLLGSEGMEKIKNSRVIVFGVGGVGGYVCEALVRCGIGSLDICDNDKVELSNFNRQIIATNDSLGRMKTDVFRERALSINPDIKIRTYNTFYLPENKDEFNLGDFDYIVDAIDTVTSKLTLIEEAHKSGTPIMSAMGTGNKKDPKMLDVTDIFKTSQCPLARVMRYELKKRNIKNLKVIYSKEKPVKVACKKGEKPTVASCSFVPSVAGLIIASEVIKDLIN